MSSNQGQKKKGKNQGQQNKGKGKQQKNKGKQNQGPPPVKNVVLLGSTEKLLNRPSIPVVSAPMPQRIPEFIQGMRPSTQISYWASTPARIPGVIEEKYGKIESIASITKEQKSLIDSKYEPVNPIIKFKPKPNLSITIKLSEIRMIPLKDLTNKYHIETRNNLDTQLLIYYSIKYNKPLFFAKPNKDIEQNLELNVTYGFSDEKILYKKRNVIIFGIPGEPGTYRLYDDSTLKILYSNVDVYDDEIVSPPEILLKKNSECEKSLRTSNEERRGVDCFEPKILLNDIPKNIKINRNKIIDNLIEGKFDLFDGVRHYDGRESKSYLLKCSKGNKLDKIQIYSYNNGIYSIYESYLIRTILNNGGNFYYVLKELNSRETTMNSICSYFLQSLIVAEEKSIEVNFERFFLSLRLISDKNYKKHKSVSLMKFNGKTFEDVANDLFGYADKILKEKLASNTIQWLSSLFVKSFESLYDVIYARYNEITKIEKLGVITNVERIIWFMNMLHDGDENNDPINVEEVYDKKTLDEYLSKNKETKEFKRYKLFMQAMVETQILISEYFAEKYWAEINATLEQLNELMEYLE